MKINSIGVILEDARSIGVYSTEIEYTDVNGARIVVPIDLVVRLYELTKFDFERRGVNWDEYCNGLLV